LVKESDGLREYLLRREIVSLDSEIGVLACVREPA
jgi:hypothetical protein